MKLDTSSEIKWRAPKDTIVLTEPVNMRNGHYKKIWPDRSKYMPHDGPQACERRRDPKKRWGL